MMNDFRTLFVAFLLVLFPVTGMPWVTGAQAGARMVAGDGQRQGAAKKKQHPAAPAKAPQVPWKLKPMTVAIVQGAWSRCEPDCPRWIVADGDIAESTPADFRRVLKQAGKMKLPVLINSPGGSVEKAMEIGRMLRKAGLVVAVAETSFVGCAPGDKTCKLPPEKNGVYSGQAVTWLGFCASACPLILAGGVTRYAHSNTVVGVHQFHNFWSGERIRYRETYRIENGKKKVLSRKVVSRKYTSRESYGIDKPTRRKLVAYLTEMGVSTDLVAEMEKAPFTSLNELAPSRRAQLNLVSTSESLEPLVGVEACHGLSPARNCAAVLTTAAARPMSIAVVRAQGGCEPRCPEWISADGMITAGSPRQFKAVLSAIGDRKLPVLLNSHGGDLKAALEIGRMIRAGELVTAIASTRFLSCEGAGGNCDPRASLNTPIAGQMEQTGLCDRECIYLLAGGVRRYPIFMREGEFTAPGSEGSESARRVRDYLKEIAIAPDLLQRAPPQGKGPPLRLTSAGLVSAGFGTRLASPAFLGDPLSCSGTTLLPNCVIRGLPKPVPGPDTAMTVVIMRGTGGCAPLCPEWIAASGVITPDTPKLFEAALAQRGGHALPVIVNSVGGDFDAALDIGRMIRTAGLPVAAAETAFIGCDVRDAACRNKHPPGTPYKGMILHYGTCGRECLLVLAGGVRRYAAHASGTILPPVDSFTTRTAGASARQLLQNYLSEMSIMPDVLRRASTSSFANLDESELEALGFETDSAAPLELGEAGACTGSSPAVNCVRRDLSAASPAPAPPAAAGLPPPAADEMIVVRMRAKGSCGTLCPEWIMAEGAITELTVQRFRAILDEAKDVNLPVVLNSVGGDLDAALAIGRMIRARGLDTIVATTEPLGCAPRDQSCNRAKRLSLPYTGFTYTPGTCARECLFILAAGVRRSGLWQNNSFVPSLDRLITHSKDRSARDIAASYLAFMRVTWNKAGEGFDTGTPELDVETTPAACRSPVSSANCVRRENAS